MTTLTPGEIFVISEIVNNFANWTEISNYCMMKCAKNNVSKERCLFLLDLLDLNEPNMDDYDKNRQYYNTNDNKPEETPPKPW